MKSIVILAVLLSICISVSASENSGKLLQDFRDPKFPLDFCTVTDAVQGFFTGTEKDPSVANSRCVIYFPTLLEQANIVISGVNSTLLIPTHFFAWLQTGVTLINRYSLWQNYCTFATIFTQLDNSVQNTEGLIGVLYKFVLNNAKITETFTELQEHFNGGRCFDMFLSSGKIFSLLFDFNVPEDII